MQNEIWKPVKGWEGYYKVSNLGRVISLRRYLFTRHGVEYHSKEKFMSICINQGGYHFVHLTKNGKKEYGSIHRLVAKAFISNPLNKKCVNHLDSNRKNNNVKNLEWVTHSENTRHAITSGRRLHLKGELAGNAKLNNADVEKIRADYKSGKYKKSQIAKEYNLNQSTIGRIVKRVTWKNI